MLSLGGFTYYAKAVTGPKIIWVCSTHNSKGCRARVHTLDDEVIIVKNFHVHEKGYEMKFI